MRTPNSLAERLRAAVRRDRLVDSALRLVEVPSRTGEAGAVLDRLADLLRADGFAVERAAAGWPAAPAVIVRLNGPKPGRTLQFNGHVDTVHLPFVPPAVEGGRITGSGSCDMKGGTAAAVEALRVLRDTGALTAGGVLFTAHDLHEAPWGFGQQLDRLIQDGVVGDAVLIPEPMCDRLPVVGRGSATWKVTIRRQGPPVHEVMRPADEPSVIAAGAELIRRLGEFGARLADRRDASAGQETVFVGQVHSGEIFNQYPQECWMEGTRRWLPGVKRDAVEAEFRQLLDGVARDTGTGVGCEFRFIRDAFHLDPADPLVTAFQACYRATRGEPLPLGPKAFVDDGNSFYGLGPIPAITHGPRSGGQHTVNEWVDIDDLERVAWLYALTAVAYCAGASPEGEAA
ncbi:MAG: M20/M25/M40 family metallo-hydrolase [Gemmataceae bacterium]